jgi:hypothetical protein
MTEKACGMTETTVVLLSPTFERGHYKNADWRKFLFGFKLFLPVQPLLKK